MKRSIHIHLPDRSWKVKTRNFDVDLTQLETCLTKGECCWIPIHSIPHHAEAHIYLSNEMSKQAVLETIVEE